MEILYLNGDSSINSKYGNDGFKNIGKKSQKKKVGSGDWRVL